MNSVTLTIDGRQVSAAQGTMIAAAARQAGIEIPTLCDREGLKPSGNCRICVVEVQGQSRLVGSCHTPVEQGMVVFTHSHRVVETRKIILELMLTAHTGPCMSDAAARDCGVHRIAADVEAGPPRFGLKRPRFYPVEVKSPYVRRDMSRCILCRNCVRACDEIAGRHIYAMAYRGFESKVVVDCDEELATDVCKDCGICIDYCPTSALMYPDGSKQAPQAAKTAAGAWQEPSAVQRTRLLDLLTEARRQSRELTPDALQTVAGQTGLALGDVYGAATFYAFLGNRRRGKHVIRICRSLPCFLKQAPLIIEQVKKILGIEPGQVTADGRFSFELTNCIGACDQAPAMLIDERLYGNLTAGSIANILKSYESEDAS